MLLSIVIFFFCNFPSDVLRFLFLLLLFGRFFRVLKIIIRFVHLQNSFRLVELTKGLLGALLRVLVSLLLGGKELLLDGVELGLAIYLPVRSWILNIIRFFFISVNFSIMLV